MNEPIKKYALFFRNRREKISETMFRDSDGPWRWTLYNDILYDTWDDAAMNEYTMRRTNGHQTAIREVVINRPDDLLEEERA